MWLKDWQTFIAGILAIAGGFIGGLTVWRQTKLIEKREQVRMDRQHSAGARSYALGVLLSPG